MTDIQYMLNSALPFDISEEDAKEMLDAAPNVLWMKINNAEGHEQTVLAYDALGLWVSKNWQRFC